MNTAYKVVKKRRNGSRVSVIVEDWHPAYQVYMRNGEIQTVNNGFVFQYEEDAMNWIEGQKEKRYSFCCNLNSGEDLELWECEYVEENFVETMIHPRYFLMEDIIKRYSKKIFKENKYFDIVQQIYGENNKVEKAPLLENVMSVNNIRLTQKIS